jgi:hypothetical protein
MTEALTDATTAELRENNLVAVPRDAWTAMQDRMDNLESELENQSQNVGGAFAKIGKVEDRVDDLEAHNQQTEAHSEGSHPGNEAGDQASTNDETPLYRVCALPEQIAARELSANQERARFIARDVRDYAEKAPAGLVIDSRAIKRVITAKEGTKPHTQTVTRVMDFLDRLGKDAVEQVKRRGKKLVVVDPDQADRLSDASGGGTNHARCDQESGPTHPERVISG